MIALTTTSTVEIVLPASVAIAALTTLGIYLSRKRKNGNSK